MVSRNAFATANRRAGQVAQNRGRHAYRDSLPAPIGGWNTRDELANMDRADAQVLDNWLPGVGQLEARKGFTAFSFGVGSGRVETLVKHVGTTERLLAAGSSSIYDITTSQASLLKTGFATARFDTENFNNRTVFVNGSDFPVEYDGVSVNAASFSGLVDPDRFFAVHVFKNRVYYLRKGALEFWYTELFASTGIVTKFPLTGIASRGGSAAAINSWTVDGGEGPEDYLAIFTTEGEVLVYAGTDPGTDFQIVGRYYIGPIVDQRAVTKVFGKLYVATLNDYVWLPDVLQTEGVQKPSKLSGAAASSLAKHFRQTGWQAMFSPAESLLLVNVPTATDVAEQHVLNMKTRAATRFTGLNAHSWCEFDEVLYFGGNGGAVYKLGGVNDNGSPIELRCAQAPSVMRRNAEKRVPAYRPILRAMGNLTVSTGLGFDHGRQLFRQQLTMQNNGLGVLPLDWPFDWPVLDEIRQEWFKGTGRGTTVQYFQDISQTNEVVRWYRTDFIVATDGIYR